MLESPHTVYVLVIWWMLSIHRENSIVALSFPGKVYLQCVIEASACNPCDTSWLNYQSRCIKFFPERKTWSEARKTCRAHHGDLVTLHDEKKQTFVYSNLAVQKTLWIGLKRNENDVFHWVDGTELQFTNWITGAPDTLSEKCGEMTDYGQFHGRWNDKSCSVSQAFICETALKKFSNVFRIFPGKILLGHVINRSRVKSDVECVLRCQRHHGCESINFVRSSSGSKGQSICELNQRVNGVLSDILHTEQRSCYYVVI